MIAWISLGVAFASALWIAIDVARHPQKMAVMNLVWPIAALYFSVAAVWAYHRFGRATRQSEGDGGKKGLRWQEVALSTSHCGAGCTVADIISESAVFALGGAIAGVALYADFVWDFVAAWLIGIVFQYFAIVPMRHLSPGEGIWAAIKADTMSIAAFQIGMYAWMALVWFVLFPRPHLHPNEAAFWFMMQIGMIAGFATSYPANILLLKAGWKERMG